MRIFSSDSPLIKALNFIADLVMLNLCFIICCIPFFTVGASVTALYTVTLAIAERREGNVVPQFFSCIPVQFSTSNHCMAFIDNGSLSADIQHLHYTGH